MRVKLEVLRKFGFPFAMKSGLIGKIDIQIPWRNLTSKPLQVTVEDVFVHIVPIPTEEWDENEYL